METSPQPGRKTRLAKSLKENLVTVLLSVLLTINIGIVSWSVRGNEVMKDRQSECETQIALNTQSAKQNCEDIEAAEKSMSESLALMNTTFEQRLTSVERVLALVFEAVTGNKIQEDQ